jgi:2-octaprenyl-6-methoxyphenol hydroxylase
MTQDRFDIIVSGAGLAGWTATAAFGQAGFSVLCVDPTPHVTARDVDGADLRSTAFLQPARDFLVALGLWERLADHATPLEVMQIIDAGGLLNTPRLSTRFEAQEISDLPFGWNLPNWLLRRELLAHLQQLPTVELRGGIASTALFTRLTQARVTFSDGSRACAKLVVAADGPKSKLRASAGISARVSRYGQRALTFAVTHSQPHDNISTEIHRTGGPFTLVPLPDYQGQPSSAVVWMETSAKANALHKLPVKQFEAAMSERSCNVLGPLKLASQRTIWPILSQTANRLTGQRLALVAEAAHVMPPIGAQGLNTSLKDVQALLLQAKAHPGALGDNEMLERYHRSRIADIRACAAGIEALNRASMMVAQPLRDARAVGLRSLHGLGPLRKSVMQLGLGVPKAS